MSTERAPHQTLARDEGRHTPGDEALWNESYYADFVDQAGQLAGYVRLGLYPNLGVSWWTAMVVGPERPVVASVAYDLAVPADPGLAVGGPGFATALEAPEPLERFTVVAETTTEVFDHPAQAYQGGGRPGTLALDLAWGSDGTPYHYDVTTRYELPCQVEGSVVVDGTAYQVAGPGQRDHSWGVRDWWASSWCWLALRLDDGTRVHAVAVRGSSWPLGYLQEGPWPGPGKVADLRALSITEDLGEAGLPTAARVELEAAGDDGERRSLVLVVEPLAFGPLLLTAPDGRQSRFPRAQARFTAPDGRTGLGWIEWNQPPA